MQTGSMTITPNLRYPTSLDSGIAQNKSTG